ncbi:condensation domain-containing protein [Nonomuraea candida]|uniref:condensation domain-containing protein n=1 Tax=Nonomuraea candida TaxID=359159 RepID=UPI0005B8B8F1|nr:condensation domain-containing protein [Nonomuraea candida]
MSIAGLLPLSWNQGFLRAWDQGDEAGPFGPRYIIVCGYRLTGPVDPDVLQEALDEVVARHEALRTEIVRDGDGHQVVHPPRPVRLTVRDLPGDDRDRRAEELLNEAEAEAYPIKELPLVRAVLGRFGDDDAVLGLIAHHTAVDEWSIRLIMRDVAHGYATRTGHRPPDLPEVLQYRDYVDWERAGAGGDDAERALAYWREKLAGAQVLGTRTDHLRSAGLPKTTAWRRFSLPGTLTGAVRDIVKETRSSPFMVLLAAYAVYLGRREGTADVVVPSFSSGRGPARFHETVGSFFNYLPFRIALEDCRTFKDVITRTRQTCVEAYANDLPFGQILGVAPALMAPVAQDDCAVVAFQVFKSPPGTERGRAGDLAYEVIHRRRLSQWDGGDVPDGGMWHLEIDSTGDIVGSFAFNTNLYSEERVDGMVEDFSAVLKELTADLHGPLRP